MNQDSINTFEHNQRPVNKRTYKRKLEQLCRISIEAKKSRTQEVNSKNDHTHSESRVINDSNENVSEIQNLGFSICSENDEFIRNENFENINEECLKTMDEIFENNDSDNKFKNFLKFWSLKFNIKNKALSELLKLLRDNGHPDLPKDSRTLKETPREILCKDVFPGKYWHFGIKRMVELLKKKGINYPDVLTLNVNIDGLPLYKSSKGVFWPILGKFSEIKCMKPFVIGLYFHVSKKPDSPRLFLNDFIDEMKSLANTSFLNTKIYPGMFIMDAPACAFVKQIVGHNAKKACGRCEVVGEFHGRMCYPQISNKSRTDEEFRNRVDKEHHKTYSNDDSEEAGTKSPLEDIEDVDMIESFPPDYLHIVLLGDVKKMLSIIYKKLKIPTNDLIRRRLNKTNFNNIYLSLSLAQMTKPTEFHRAIRSLEYLSFYKGTEFRNFLLYHGLVALKANVDDEIYENFKDLHCAITICLTNKHRKYVPAAKLIFEKYFRDFKKIYGKCMVSYNIHQTLHLADYVIKYGPLENYSAFEYESKLGIIGNLICSGNNPLEQGANRIIEHLELDMEELLHNQKKGMILNIYFFIHRTYFICIYLI